MNQMVGSSSTALADVLERQINISTPNVKKMEVDNPDLTEFIGKDDTTIKISFVMEIEDLLVSNIMQIIPFESGKEILSKILTEDEIAQEAEASQGDDFVAVDTEVNSTVGAAREKGMVGVKAVQYQNLRICPGVWTWAKTKTIWAL